MADNPIEIWKDIDGYESRYQISSCGRVRSINRILKSRSYNKKDMLLKQNISSNGYFSIGLSKNGKVKTCLIHRLVSAAFLTNPDDKRCVNHIDGIKTNNNLQNLEWATDKENSAHAWNNGLARVARGMDSGVTNLDDMRVLTIKTLVDAGWHGTTVAKHYGIGSSTVYAIKNNKTWKHLNLK